MLLDKTNATNIRLLWDCEFYYNLLLGVIKINNNSIIALIASAVIRECTVFVKEMAMYNPKIGEAISSSSSQLFKKTYPLVRDRIHYFTSNPVDYLKEKSDFENTIHQIQSFFLTRPMDDLYSWRYDLSYLKVKNTIYTSSIDMYFLFRGTDIQKSGNIFGPAIKQYSADLASMISSSRHGFTDSGLGDLIHLPDLCVGAEDSDIGFFDGKFDLAVKRSGFSEHLTVVLLRILSDIGSLRYIVENLFTRWSDTYYLYFFTRWIAIRFDEISDAMYRIEKHFPADESAKFINFVKSEALYPFPENFRLIAKRLRNSIHYNAHSEIWDIDFGKSFFWHNNFLKQACTNKTALSSWPKDYHFIKNEMMTHLSSFHECLAEIFDYDLKYMEVD
jgi:hypothetical protein